ncbi:DEAD/DEAH box helicase family protein [Streptomyces sp. NPDC048257]|uniref:DEAD/DEAH box helicase family protein n=1 Tax=Streptomyces sp. NPDC048257 TaxID=3365526 RepID=UPI00371B52E2
MTETDTNTPPLLRPHQSEALARAIEELTPRSPAELPAAGMRTQGIMATGSGKTLVAVRAADQVGGDRVLVPSLDLLDQTARAWRDRRPRRRVLTKRSLFAYPNDWPCRRGALGGQSVKATRTA